MQIPNAGFITISEYTWNRPKSMILPGGSTKEFAYDPLMRVKSITAKDPGQNVLLNYQYTFDKVDNITQKATEHGDYAFDYDDLYRLADVDNPDFDDEAFTYDGVGNRLTAEGVNGDWSYNINNELTGYDDVSYVYDANGNMTQKTAAGVVTKFFYNTEDRLSEVRDGSDNLIASYYYDPFGRRLWKEVAGVRTYFHYADEGLIGEYGSTGAEIKTYGYKPGSTWTTDPLFMKVGTDYYFYHTDHLGTPQKMTAINGAVVWSAKYSSFGEANVDDASTVTNNLRFPGQYEDTETELHYNYHRYYYPKLGRYLSTDPIGASSEEHLYGYANNMPIVYGDIRGMYCKRITPWKRVNAFENDTDKGKLLSRTFKGKWKKINEWVLLPLPGRNMPRGGGTAKIGYGCQWENVGCQQTSIYEKPVLYEANFNCGIDECPRKEWEERRTKEFTKRFTEKKNIRCHFSSRKEVTYSWIKGGCREPSY